MPEPKLTDTRTDLPTGADHDKESDEVEVPSPTPPIPRPEAIELDGFRLDVNYFLSKDYDDISAAAQELPPTIEWINCKLQSLTEQKLLKQDDVERFEAEAWFYLNQGGWEDLRYAGRKNAHALLMGVRLDQKVQKAKQELAVLTAWTQRLYNVMSSLQAKLELVRSSEATRRRILDSEHQ